jgi:uncharacterized membrane protein YjjP (DUF1212 family)
MTNTKRKITRAPAVLSKGHGVQNETDYLLCLALDVGEGMLKCGAEISRVEDTIERICRAYGAEHVEVFSIISVIIAAVRMPDGSYSSQIRRVYDSENNFHRLELFNEISRRICRETPPLPEFEEMIKKAKTKKLYPVWVKPVASIFVTGGFAIFFGGSIWDGLASGIVGAIIFIMAAFLDDKINSLAKIFISSIVGGFLSCIAIRIGLGQDIATIIIGNIMIQIPGIAFGTSLRDLLGGDLLAGSLRLIQSLLSAAMIAFGYMLSLAIMGGGF